MSKTLQNTLVWLALLALLVTTVFVWMLDLGVAGAILGLMIAAAKAGLVAAFFMHLKDETARTVLMASGGLFWLTLLFGLTLADYYTRSH